MVSVTPASPDNEAIRELRDSVKSLNKTIGEEVVSMRRFSMAFMTLALVQIALVLMQFALDVFNPDALWIRIVLFVLGLAAMVWIFWDNLRDQ